MEFLDSGAIGVGHDGLLKVHDSKGLNLKQKGQLNKLLADENQDRERLYKEIAVANNFPEQIGEVRNIFAESWRNQAKAGWYLEKADGSWIRK